MNPEAVQPRFLNDYDRERFSSPCKSLLLESRKPRQQHTNIPGSHTMLRHFLAAAGDSAVISQLERLSSSETKIAPRSLRIALGASGRSGLICMVVPRVGGCSRTLPECRSL